MGEEETSEQQTKKKVDQFIKIGSAILMILSLAAMVYMVYNVELLKADPCAVCMNKTGAVCYRGFLMVDTTEEPEIKSYQTTELNFS
jgi:hypothetical protein